MAKEFLNKANTFVDTMGEDGDNKEERREHHHRGGHHCRGGKGGRKEWGFCGERSKWAEKRAIIVRKPEEVIVCEPGKIIFVEVEVQN